MTKANPNVFVSNPYPQSTPIRIGRWRPSVFKPSSCQYNSFNFSATISPLSTMSVFFRTLSRPTTSSRPLFPVPFVSSFERDDGQGESPPSESSSDSNSDSPPSTPSQSFQTCVSGGSLQEEGVRPSVRPSRSSSMWIPVEQGAIVHPFGSSSAGSDASPDGDNESGGSAWGGDGEGSSDGYVAGDESSSPTQCLRVSELSVGGEEREGSVETL